MAVPTPNYAHRATYIEGHDGDSFWLRVDFGMNTHGVRLELPLYVRLYEFDAVELHDPSGVGLAAAEFVDRLMASGAPIVVQTVKDDGKTVGEEKYGRWLARVWVGSKYLPDLLRENGFEKLKRAGGLSSRDLGHGMPG